MNKKLSLIIILTLLISLNLIPHLSKNSKVRLSILLNCKITILLLLLCITFLLYENITIGILSIILFFNILLYKTTNIEQFITYFN